LNLHYQTRYVVAGGQLYRGACVYFANHRSQADFWIDNYLTEGRAVFLARWMVGILFWPILPFSVLIGNTLFFHRGATRRGSLYAMVDNRLARTGYDSLLVYPEGTRHTGSSPLPLKKGFLRYAYDRNLPIQCIVSRGKESVFSVRQRTARTGVVVRTVYAEPVYPDTSGGYESFVAAVEGAWDGAWDSAWTQKESGSEQDKPLFALPVSPYLVVLVCLVGVYTCVHWVRLGSS
jgi:1-acyl-sn-glycerol-3-phosphate acyltransferase